MSDVPAGLTDYLNLSPQTSQIPQGPIADVSAPSDVPAGLTDYVAPELNQEKYGGFGGAAQAFLEGAERGLTFGGSDVYKTKVAGENPEDIRGRQEANPISSFLGSVAGAAVPIAVTGGAALPEEAGLAATSLASAAEGAAFGAGNAVSDYALDNGNLDAQKILSDVGMGAALGLGAGALGYGLKSLIGKSGAIKGTVSDILDNEANSANSEARTTEAIAKEANLKLNTPEIIQAGQDIGAPFIPETVSTDPWVQRFGDALKNGAPSIAGNERTALYNQGWEAATKTASDMLPAEGLTKNQLGSSLQDAFATKISEENAPLSDLYNEIKADTQNIPLSENSTARVASNIKDFIEEEQLLKNSPAGKLALDVSEHLPGLNNVDQLRRFQSSLKGMLSPTASPQEKRILSIISDKLGNLEEGSIKGYAQDLLSKYDITNPEEVSIWGDKMSRIGTLLSRIDEADAQYRPFRQKISELSEWLGKGRISGPKDAIDFIQNRLEPEDLATKLTQKKYASMFDFLDKNFPEESALVKDYMKSQLRESSMLGESVDPKKFAKNVFKLEPEIREKIFAPDELQKIKSIKTYLDSFPRNYNPSGTAGASAMRHFLESPAAATIGNVRDFAMKKYIDAMVSIPEELRPDPTIAGHEMAQKFNQLNAAAKIVEKTNKRINEGISSVLGLGGSIAGPALVGGHSFEQKSDRLKELSDYNTLGAQIQNHIQGTSAVLPNISQGIATSIASSVNYLNSVMPKSEKPLPLSPRIKISDAQKQHFNRTFDIVNDPVSILKHIKEGTLTTNDVKALQATHPDLYKDLQNKFIERGVSDRMVKLPYKTKQALSLFMGMPLDAGQVPAVKIANQSVFNMNVPQQQASQMPRRQRSTLGGLKQLDISGQYKTRTSREKTEEDL